MMERITKAMSLDPKIVEFIRELVRRAQLHVGVVARRARNKLARARGEEPEPNVYSGVRRWMRYHKRVPATFPEKPHYQSIGRQPGTA